VHRAARADVQLPSVDGSMADRTEPPMCNLYSMTTNQRAINELAKVMRDSTGNMPSLPGIFPDYPAPIIRNHTDGRELAMARWGMPPPPSR
jgi:putative SOS response-associated peptidase YedK